MIDCRHDGCRHARIPRRHYQRVRLAGMKMLKEGCPALRADPEESPLQLSS
jgi:hypothetical protein